MRSILLAIAVLAPQAAFATNVYGNLTGSNSWTLANSPYVMTGDVTVAAGASLTIEAGVTVTAATTDLMAAGTDTNRVELIVKGSLTALGTAGAPIVFTSQGSGKGSWVGIRFESTSTANSFGYASIQKAIHGLETAVDTTASNVTASTNTYAFYPTAGTLSVDHSTISGNDYGIYYAGGAVNANTTSVTANTNYGIYLGGAGSGTLHHLTIAGNGSYGLYASISTGASYTVRDSIIASNSSYGVYRSGSSGTFNYSYCDAWGNVSYDTYGVTAGNGTFTANPLFAGGGNYRITSNSPARSAGSDGSDLGALGYTSDATGRLVGTIWSSQTLSGANTVTGDLTVAPGVTLTLASGATLTFATSDESASGADTARAELIVKGALVASGDTSNPVTFTSAGSSKGSWYGIRFLTGSTGNTVSNVVINEAVHAIDSAVDLSVANASISTSTYGLYPSGGTLTVTGSVVSGNDYGSYYGGGALNASTTQFTGNTNYGVYLAGAGTGTLHHLTISGNGSYGVYASLSTGANVTLRDSIIANNSSYGVYRSGSSGTFSYSTCDAWGNVSYDTYGVTAGAGTFAANPLVVGNGNYRLTSNSPARQAAADGSDLGALPYTTDATGRLTGNLTVNTTLSGANTVTGDLTVATGVTLTLSPGATLTFATGDEMAGGVDTSHAELIVKGTLNAAGTAGSPVTLTSSGSSKGSWYGVRLLTGSTGHTLSGLNISKANHAIDSAVDATISNSTLSGSTYGLYPTAGTLTVTGSLVSGNDYGGYCSGGALASSRTQYVSNTNYGIYLSGAGTGVLDHLTVAANGSYGVYASLSTGANYTLRDSIISNNSSYGVYRSGSSGTFNYSYDDAWGNVSYDTYGVTAGSGTFAANPLYVGGGNFRITSNSPARQAGSDGTDLGALAYTTDATGRLTGTLYVSTTLGGANTVTGDLTVASGVTLTLSPGATLTFATSDEMAGGVDTSHAELIVKGALNAAGTSASPVTLTSSGSSKGSWYGVRVLTGSTGNVLTFVNVSKANHAIDSAADVTLNALIASTNTYGIYPSSGMTTVTNAVLTGNDYGIYTSGGSLNASYSVISSNTNYGIYLSGTGAGTLHHLTVAANGSYGLYASLSTGANYTVRDSIVASNSSYGVYRSGSSGTFSYSTTDAWGNTSYDTYGVTAGAGTFASNPLFISASDLHLQATSPARGVASDGTDLGAYPYSVGAVASIVVTPGSGSVVGGATRAFSAAAFDSSNQPVPGVTFTWSALPAAGTITTAGVLTAGCTPGTVAGAVTASASGKSGSAAVTITLGTATQVSIAPTTAQLGAGGTQTFTATAKDACNNPVSAAFTWSGAPGSITQGGVFTAPCAPGTYASAVTVTTGAGSASAAVTVSLGALTTLTLTPQNPSLPLGGQQQFTVAGSDGCGNALTPSATFSASPAAGTITAAGLFTATAAAGSYGSAVTVSQGAITASTGVTLTGGAVATVTVTPATASLAPGAVQQFTAVAKDSMGNVAPGAITWSVVSGGGAIDQTGKFTASNTTGAYGATVHAALSGVSGSSTVSVIPGPATSLTVTPGTATLAPSGTTSFSARVADAFGNVRADPVTWSVSPAAAGTVTPGGVFTAGVAPGNYPGSVVATAGSLTGSASVTVQAGALSQLQITPLSTTVRASGTVAFTVTGRDGNGNVVPVTPSWAIVNGGGTITAAGVVTAGISPGTFPDTVQAQANGLAVTATLTVTPGPAVQLDISPSHPQLDPNATVQFSAKARDAFGNEVTGVPLNWFVQGQAGAVDSKGLFTAGTVPGDYASAVVVASGGITGRASVQVNGTVQATDGGTPDAGTLDGGGDTLEDGGVMPKKIDATSGCGCSSGAGVGGLPFLALGMLLLARRRFVRG